MEKDGAKRVSAIVIQVIIHYAISKFSRGIITLQNFSVFYTERKIAESIAYINSLNRSVVSFKLGRKVNCTVVCQISLTSE